MLNSTADQILAIVEICFNVLKFNFPLDLAQKKLIKHADFYLQKGSGIALGALLIPIVSALAQVALDKFTR